MGEARLLENCTAVADQSHIPVLLDNHPHAVAGTDMTSDFIVKISQHPNSMGTIFTDGNAGKLTRVASAMDAYTPKRKGTAHMALGGMANITILPGNTGGSGIVSGGANVMPNIIVKAWKIYDAKVR